MRDLVEAHRRDLLEAVVEAVGDDPFARLHEGTSYLQPAIYCASMACLELLSGPAPDFYAGHSLGELSALVAAGSLDEEDGLRLVVTRGRLMQRAAAERPHGAMLAVGAGLGFATELAESLGLTVANDNSPEQVVLSGDADAVVRARLVAKSRGFRAFRLPIKGAFHSPAMAGVVPEFRAALDAVDFRPPRRPVFSCVTGAEFDDVRRRLAESLTHGVRWREVLVALRSRGASRFLEVPPGKVLTGLVHRTLDGVEASPVGELETVGA